MKKFAYSILLAFFPALALATGGALSFAPPPSDVSVVFLGNIFGTVDGVLHGTGSQIMGNIFGVFNAAVLALGGIVIIYTLLVATINTAHEGQMLGQKWSSIWVPVRSTLGLALLIPKASGFCLMQIFVMWVVVQGVGAADKVWDSALSYLNRGGVIVQQQVNPLALYTSSGSGIANTASTILSGQVCMIGLQQMLTIQRDGYLKRKSNDPNSGNCANPSGAMIGFCNTAVPDFLASVNAVAYQNDPSVDNNPYSLSMPNFPKGNAYAGLNGVCGYIKWFPISGMSSVQSNITGITSSELQTASMSRALGIQQMYSDLSTVAQIMINNDPQLGTPNSSSSSNADSKNNFASWAVQQFGVAYLNSGKPCQSTNVNCVTWGDDPSNTTSSSLFSGTEFQGAIADYNGIMLPTLNLIYQASNNSTANEQRKFIQQASLNGWMLAGSYFFNLATINTGNATTSGTGTDGAPVVDSNSNSGLDKSVFTLAALTNGFNPNGSSCQGGDFPDLCTFMGGDVTPVNKVITLIDGSPTVSVSTPTIPSSTTTTVNAVNGLGSSTAWGFITNSLLVQIPGQQGLAPPQFVFKIQPSFNPGNSFSLPPANFSCGEVKIIWPFSFCLVQWLGELFYNFFIKFLLSWLLQFVAFWVNLALMAFLSLPLQGMAAIFTHGVSYIQQPNVNPVVALAYMGVNYINFAMDLWIYLITLAIMCALIPVVGIFIFALIALVMPLLLAWLGTMVTIGFVTAYFIPFTPYMIFTFGSIAWLMAVIEAMVAAPIVALGITSPEGEGPFGKGEQAIMILMNVFLRPALMIIGYIAGIILSYVAVWVINAGFANVAVFVMGSSTVGGFIMPTASTFTDAITPTNQPTQTSTGYTGWAGIYGFFFSILVYTTMYLAVVQKAFTLITTLPDKVLRWIGGQPESVGQEAAQWGEESKKQVETSGQSTYKAGAQMDKQIGGYAIKGIGKLQEAGQMGMSGE